MKKFRLSFAVRWRSLVTIAVALTAVTWLYTFRLGTLTHRLLSSQEVTTRVDNNSLHNILHDPINVPYKLLDFVFLRLSPHSIVYARLTSVVLSLVAIALFFGIMHRWHGKRAAILATILFGASSWQLHVGRLGNGGSTFVLVPLALLLFTSWLNATKKHGSAIICMALVAALALFTPGAVWFLAASYVLVWKTTGKHVVAARQHEKVLSAVILVGAITVLGYVTYRSPHVYKEWLALPATFPAPLTLIRQWLDSVAFLFVRGPYAPDAWLAHTPIFDVFSTAIAAVGGYFYATHYRNLRSHMLAVFLAIGSALVALNGVAVMSFIVPVAYLIAGTGLTYVLHKWLSVFPRNPVARSVGIGLLTLVVICAAIYHLTNYFVAWRYSPTTVAAFRSHP